MPKLRSAIISMAVIIAANALTAQAETAALPAQVYEAPALRTSIASSQESLATPNLRLKQEVKRDRAALIQDTKAVISSSVKQVKTSFIAVETKLSTTVGTRRVGTSNGHNYGRYIVYSFVAINFGLLFFLALFTDPRRM